MVIGAFVLMAISKSQIYIYLLLCAHSIIFICYFSELFSKEDKHES